MLCRYRKKGIKQYTFGHQVYKFTDQWSDVNDIRLFRALQSYPDVFDTLCFFDLSPFLSIANQIRFKKNLILTCSKTVAEKLSNMPYVKKQAYKPETGEFIFKALQYSSEDLTSYENTDGAINILAHRDLGGIGDIIMTTSVIEEAIKKYPNYNVTYACPEQFLPLLKNNPFITKSKPINSSVTQEDWDAIIDLTSDCIKHEMKYQPDVKLNRVEIFAKKCGIPIKNIASPKIFLSEDEILRAKEELKNYKLKIGLVLKSNAPVRNWPYFKKLRSLLSKQYPAATFLEFCINKPKEWNSIKKSHSVFGRDLRDVCALINECDVVVAPDTGLAHIASALKVPTVWLFTHIDGKIRTKNYDNVEVCQNIPEDCPSKGVPCWYNVLCDKERVENSFNPPCSIALAPELAFKKIKAILGKPNVSYCVVFKDNEEITKECIERILKYKKYNDELVLVDNGSEKELFNHLKENGSVTIIRNSKNKGCIIARNQAMKRAKGEYLFILDNDQYISGISTHKMMCTEGDIIGVEGWSMDSNGYAFENYEKLAYVGGGGMLVKKQTAKEIEYLDEIYAPAWFSDPDFCFKAREKGFTLGHCKNAKIEHLKHKTIFSQTDFDHQEAWKNSHKIFCNKWAGKFNIDRKKELEKKKSSFEYDFEEGLTVSLIIHDYNSPETSIKFFHRAMTSIINNQPCSEIIILHDVSWNIKEEALKYLPQTESKIRAVPQKRITSKDVQKRYIHKEIQPEQIVKYWGHTRELVVRSILLANTEWVRTLDGDDELSTDVRSFIEIHDHPKVAALMGKMKQSKTTSDGQTKSTVTKPNIRGRGSANVFRRSAVLEASKFWEPGPWPDFVMSKIMRDLGWEIIPIDKIFSITYLGDWNTRWLHKDFVPSWSSVCQTVTDYMKGFQIETNKD